MNRFKSAVLGLVVVSMAALSAGCNGTTMAQDAQKAIGVAVAVAQAEEALVPVADQSAFKSYVALVQGLDTQLGTCLSNVSGLMGKNAKFLSCFNTFASGVASPAELAQLRLVSQSTQARAQLIVGALIAGVNIAESDLGGQPQVVPAVSPSAMNYLNSPEGSAQVAQTVREMRVAAGI